jgi:hypothetical protein
MCTFSIEEEEENKNYYRIECLLLRFMWRTIVVLISCIMENVFPLSFNDKTCAWFLHLRMHKSVIQYNTELTCCEIIKNYFSTHTNCHRSCRYIEFHKALTSSFLMMCALKSFEWHVTFNERDECEGGGKRDTWEYLFVTEIVFEINLIG